jgi:hypothetical protein
MPTPAKPIEFPRVFVLAAMSWYRASSRPAHARAVIDDG